MAKPPNTSTQSASTPAPAAAAPPAAPDKVAAPAKATATQSAGAPHAGGTMRAIRIHQYGGPERLLLEDAPVPEPTGAEVLVRVRAASINPIDYKIASGTMRDRWPVSFPWIPGGDFCGVVEALGPAARGVRAGDVVFGNSPGGGAYAEFVVASTAEIAPRPDGLDDVEAASVPLAAQTAWQALFDHGHLERGESVLIHAGAGGVGSFAVQLAHWKGAKVMTTSSADHADYLRGLGADRVIDYRNEHFETAVKDVDLVLDLVGGDTQARSYDVLRSGGRLVSTVQPPDEAAAARRKVHASIMGMQPTTANLLQLAALLESGALRTFVTRTCSLGETRDAWTEHMSHHARGKVVLRIGG